MNYHAFEYNTIAMSPFVFLTCYISDQVKITKV